MANRNHYARQIARRRGTHQPKRRVNPNALLAQLDRTTSNHKRRGIMAVIANLLGR